MLWQAGKTTEQALQQAQPALLADKAMSHPFFWAAFVAARGAR